MVIQVDTREKARAIQKILKTFDENQIQYVSHSMVVGDYQDLRNGTLVIDRKQNLGELCNNLCSTQKKKDGTKYNRFREELKKAKAFGIKVILLIEDDTVKDIEDVKNWSSKYTKVKGITLYKTMNTMLAETNKYDIEFRFCKKEETGNKIIEILEG